MPRFFNFYSLLYFYSAFYTIINEIRPYPPLISTFKFSVTLPTHISYQFHVFFVIVVNALNLNCPVHVHMDVGPFTGIYGTYYWLHPQVIVLMFPVAITTAYTISVMVGPGSYLPHSCLNVGWSTVPFLAIHPLNCVFVCLSWNYLGG